MKQSSRMFELLFAVSLLIVINGCSKSSSEDGKGTKQAGDDAIDKSITVEEAAKMGMPRSDRIWTADDFRCAYYLLKSLKDESPQKLPHYKSPRSGPIFDRMTSPENFAALRDRSIPCESRSESAYSLMEFFLPIGVMYIFDIGRENGRDDDACEFAGTHLRLLAANTSVIEEYIPTISKDDPDFNVRMERIERFRKSASRIITRCLMLLSGEARFEQSERRMIGYLIETTPTIVAPIPVSEISVTRDRIKQLLNDPKFSHLHPEIAKLDQAVKDALLKKQN